MSARLHRANVLVGPVFVSCLIACQSNDAITIDLVTGAETDTLTRKPVPATLRVDDRQYRSDGGSYATVLATATLPTASLDLGSIDESKTGRLQVLGLDADGGVLVFGASPLLVFAEIAKGTLPLFVQRTGEFARLPRPLSDSRKAPTLAVLESRYLFVGAGVGIGDAGGDASIAQTTQLYDFLQLAPLGTPPILPRTPASIVLDGTVGWLIDGDGGTYFDFSNSYRGDIALSTGAFSDVASGATIVDGDTGVSYVVGATRTDGVATAAVLKVDPNDTSNSSYAYGLPTWLKLAAPRLGAGASWANGRGLVVVGGSANGAGVELIATGGTAGSALPYPPDDSTGSGAAMLDASHVLIAGGLTPSGTDAGVRVVDLGCAASCTAVRWPRLPGPVASAQVFVDSDGAHALVVGSESASGATHVYRVSQSAAFELPTKVPHAGARATLSPTGTVVLFGGTGEIESFTP